MTIEEQQQQSSSQTSQHRRRSSSISKKQSKETLGRRHSERHQVVKVQNYVIYRKTIGAGSMGKVKLAECLTDEHKQKVNNMIDNDGFFLLLLIFYSYSVRCKNYAKSRFISHG